MTDTRRFYLILQAEIFSLKVDGYNFLLKEDYGDETEYHFKHENNKNLISIVANSRFLFIKIFKNGKIRKTINC